jgi:hypothetical protein
MDPRHQPGQLIDFFLVESFQCDIAGRMQDRLAFGHVTRRRRCQRNQAAALVIGNGSSDGGTLPTCARAER